ncbi:OmpA family protein [Parahaliea sp. F7430]|uniref:OmpA family protein n=1 Tax=Sediminihaliea albiluteola TaxID=2758564 RepID=A0A7W2YI64_9GAMM|nr:OmpA family protein [Sediminihaliea albiluteola]MBA6411710.1 OmpA family protein [Sediminihaliea albiluteola]
MKNIVSTGLTAGLVLFLGACASQPESINELDQAKAAVASASQLPLASQVAGAQLENARKQLQLSESVLAKGGDIEQVRNHAYLASRYAEIVQQRAAEKTARDAIARTEAETNRVLLTARTAEAERARQTATAQTREAEAARAAAEAARAEAAAALAEARAMEEELAALQAERTVRGIVLTLGDVLFETNKAELLSGAYKAIDQLTEFMNDNPERRLLIEGHTDSTGAASYNQELSKRRADAVRTSLIDRGISSTRMETRGLGQDYPVASNDNAAGRQQNRRVEIVISDKKGEFPAAATR